MIRLSLLLTTLFLLLAPTSLFAQAGIKQSIQQQLQNAQEQANEQMNDTMQQNQPTDQPKPPQDTGWIQVLAKDSSLTKVRLYVSHPNFIRYGPQPRLPAVVVAPDWWGANDEITQRTDELAGKGYFAVAVDFYDGKIAAGNEQAAALKARLTNPAAQTRLTTALFYLMDKVKADQVNPQKIAVLGYGLGGDQAMRLATTDLRVKATALFYAPVITEPERLKNLKGPVFGAFGNDDKNPAPELVNQFESALAKLNIPAEIHRYDGAGHFFASRSAVAGGDFREKPAADAAASLEAWLAKTIGDPPTTQPK